MKSRRSQVIQKRVVKSILWLIITPFLLLGLAILLIHIPPIQNTISNKLTSYLTEGTGYRTEIDYVNIRWFNSITMDGAKIYDQNNELMIGVDELALSFNLSSLIGKQDFQTEEAWIYKADVNLRYTNEDIGLNITDWTNKITSLGSSEKENQENPAFLLDEVELINSTFSISDYRKDSIKEGFNYNHFQVININAELLNLKAKSDSFNIDVKYLTAKDKESGLSIDEFSTYFRYSTQGMHFLDLRLKTGKSNISHKVSFLYDKVSELTSFIDSVDVEASLQESFIHSDDLAYFAPEVLKYKSGVGVSGHYYGRINDLIGEQIELDFGGNTKFRGEVDIEGLPDIENTFLDLSFDRSQLDPSDIQDIVDPKSYAIIENFGQIEFTGQFDGFINDFVADGEFITEIGDVGSNLQINLSRDIPQYSGYLELKNFDLGRYTEDPLYQKIDLAGNIDGSGFQLDETQFNLIAEIPRFGINGYEIKKIETDGAIAQSFFSGQLSISDPNLSLFANGSVDLRDNARIFNIIGTIDNAVLDSLNLTDEHIKISTEFNFDAEGLRIDSLNGTIDLTNAEVIYKEKNLRFDTLKFSSSKSEIGRQLTFHSEQVDVSINGDFLFTSLFKEFNDYSYQYNEFFKGNLSEASRFAANEGQSKTNFDLNYEVALHDINPILGLIDSTISVAKDSWLKGSFSSNDLESFKIEGYTSELKFGDIIFKDNDIAFQGKQISSPELLDVLGYLYSKEQVFSTNTSTQDLTIEAVWDGTHIDLRNSIQDTTSGNYAELGADVDFFEQMIELKFEDSNILAYQEEWKIADNNLITFTNEKISIDSLNIFNQGQSIQLNGGIAIEKDSLETVKISFAKVDVQNLNRVTEQTYKGELNGELIAQNLLFDPLFFGELILDQLYINDFLVGDIKGDLNWNDPAKMLEVRFGVNRENKDIILLEGGIYPRSSEQLDLALTLNSSNLAIAEPYIADYVSNMDGFISGDFNISGQLNKPLLAGRGTINDGQIKINYLNTLYSFDGELKVQEDLIDIERLNLYDIDENGADFSGMITHNNYSDLRLNLTGNLFDFQVMDLPTDLQADFYGQAYASGSVNITGEASNLKIAADARTEQNSRIYIPIGKPSADNFQADYIQFIDRTDTTELKNTNIATSDVEQLKIEGFSLDLNIEVTPDAYAELIIDPRTGDIIRGRGNGQLRLVLDSDGDFQMTGGLDIEEGAYNFSLYSIINKEFQIEQPSSITWYGDPYSGIMSINASYNENTSITPILQQAGFGNLEEGNSTFGRRVPVKVLLDLQGPLLSPEINFNIDFGEVQAQDYETVTSISAFKNRIQSDEQELNRQVLSLILLGKFSNQGNVNIVGGAATQSVSQLLSNQLSQLVAQLDENLEIDFDLRDLSDEAFNTMRLRLSYTFLDGRLRVTREGGLANYQDVNSAVGDWTAEYLLTPDGRYKVKIYYRSNYDYTAGAISQSGTFTTQGASITQTSSFNSFKELFRKVEKSRSQSNRTTSSTNSGNSSN